jgi:hypothetical protein
MLLNRWRGTGVIFNIFKFGLIGNIIYALTIGLFIGTLSFTSDFLLPFAEILIRKADNSELILISNSYLFSAIFNGIVASILYIAGESYSWGKWLGSLTHPNELEFPSVYDNPRGSGFPYIHQTANFFIDQRAHYMLYARLALTIRGIYWWLPFYLYFALIGFIELELAIFLGVFVGASFSLACDLGRNTSFEMRSKYLNLSQRHGQSRS